jgi:hypothetical protein
MDEIGVMWPDMRGTSQSHSTCRNSFHIITFLKSLITAEGGIARCLEKVWGARYTLGGRYLYIIRDAEKFVVRGIYT